VTRWRRPGSGEILLVYMLLATIGAIAREFARGVGPKEPLSSLAVMAFLGSMDWVTIAGCRPAGADACTALVEGYPLRWLTAYQNVPVVSKGALFKDWAQWTLASMSVLYLAWPQRTAAAGLPD